MDRKKLKATIEYCDSLGTLKEKLLFLETAIRKSNERWLQMGWDAHAIEFEKLIRSRMKYLINSEKIRALPELEIEQPGIKAGKESGEINLKELFSDLHDVQKLAVIYLGGLGEGEWARIKHMIKYIDENYDKKYSHDRRDTVGKLFRGSKASKYFYHNELVRKDTGKYILKHPINDYTG